MVLFYFDAGSVAIGDVHTDIAPKESPESGILLKN